MLCLPMNRGGIKSKNFGRWASLFVPVFLLGFAGCKRKEQAPEVKLPPPEKRDAPAGMRPRPEPVKINPKLPPKHQELQKKLVALYPRTLAEWEQEKEDRKELVRPAPSGFKPEDIRRKIKLTLIPKTAKLRKGESFWYRLELQNVGQEPFFWYESSSFFKDGINLSPSKFRFHLIPPGGEEIEMGTRKSGVSCGGFGEGFTLPGAEKRTPKQRQAMLDEMAAKDSRKGGLSIYLQPGDVLTTRPWQDIDSVEYCRRTRRGEKVDFRAPGIFRELSSDTELDVPGTYRIRVIYDDSPSPPPDEEEIRRMEKKYGYSREVQMEDYRRRAGESLGIAKSDSISFEVIP